MVLELAREWYWAKKFWTKENAVYSAFGPIYALFGTFVLFDNDSHSHSPRGNDNDSHSQHPPKNDYDSHSHQPY
jgi:hypothetical protein